MNNLTQYKKNDLLTIAKRYNNNKRSYLLVNPLQGKHLAVSPAKALSMMESLGEKVKKKYPETKLVIGFAETATAIALKVADTISSECYCINTTREVLPEGKDFIYFSEEHSHASSQKLCADNLEEYIKNTETIILLDDELSTGKTMRNLVVKLREKYPCVSEKKFVTASILYRLNSEDKQKMDEMGIEHISLLDLEAEDYESLASNFTVAEGVIAEPYVGFHAHSLRNNIPALNPRTGVKASEYIKEWHKWNSDNIAIDKKSKILVLGTEECMLPALILGKELEEQGHNVFSHATTRSPIGVNKDDENYPIKNGFKLKSFYDKERVTYIYNLQYYDLVIVVSDIDEIKAEARISLMNALSTVNFGDAIWVDGGKYVF